MLFAEPVSKLTGARQRSRHGNRHEVRELVVSSDLNEWADWPSLGQVGQLTYTGTCTGKTTRETSSIITSLTPEQASPRALLRLIRGHWGIENRVHWVRDVTFDEDRSQVRAGSGPQVMAALRNSVIGLLRLRGERNPPQADCPAHPRLARRARDRTRHEPEEDTAMTLTKPTGA